MGLQLYYKTDDLLYECEDEGNVYKRVQLKKSIPYRKFFEYRAILFNTFDNRWIHSMQGFCKEIMCKDNCRKCTKLSSWKTVKNNLKYLINHSDVEGILTVKEMKLISPELENVDYREFLHSSLLTDFHFKLIDFMKECIKNNKDMIFG